VRNIKKYTNPIPTLLLIISIITPVAVTLAWDVSGDIDYFYAYHWEEYGITGVNIRCKADLNHTSDPPDYVKFRYSIRVLGRSDNDDPPIDYYETEWQVLGWQGDGIYDNWWNWIPANPYEAEHADYITVDVYVDDDANPDTNGADWVCGSATIISDYPP